MVILQQLLDQNLKKIILKVINRANDEELKCLWASITGDEENVKIIKFYYEDEEIENLIIPEEINGKKVVELCESSYSKVKATNLVLPKDLTVISFCFIKL